MKTPTQEAAEAIKKLHAEKKAAEIEPVEARLAKLEKSFKRLSNDYLTLSLRLSKVVKSTGLGDQLKQAIAKREVTK